MPAKMISEMPLPMPRSEICSPSHMMKAVPVVSVSTVMIGKPRPHSESCTCGRHERRAARSRLRLQPERHAERLDDRQSDRAVAGVLVDLAAAHLAFLRELLEVRPDDGEELENDRRGDVRHDAEGEDGQAAQAPPEKRSRNPNTPPDIALKNSDSATGSTPGVGMCDPSR